MSEMSIWAQLRTIPNLLSLLRLALVPVFLYLIVSSQPGFAFLVLAVASFTDWLDGYLARRLNQITRLGALLDPAADRLTFSPHLLAWPLPEQSRPGCRWW